MTQGRTATAALLMVGILTGCSGATPAPIVRIPETNAPARLYDLGSSELLNAGFATDPAGAGDFFVSLADGRTLKGRYRALADEPPGWGAVFWKRSREYNTDTAHPWDACWNRHRGRYESSGRVRVYCV